MTDNRALDVVEQIDRQLAIVGSDVRSIRALEELAEAGKRYAQTHEQRIAATVAKLKVARHGGKVLDGLAVRKERSDGGRPKETTAAVAVVSKPTLADMGISEGRSARWQALAKLSDAAFAERVEAVEHEGPEDSLYVQAPGGTKATTGVEWYTPAKYVDAAREVMGGIDLDPASSELANQTVKATTYYDADFNGLRDEVFWNGRVWLNPPYGKGSGLFTTKLVEEHNAARVEQAVLLLNAYGFDAEWFQPLWEHPICFTDHRVMFTSPQRETGGPANGNIFVYLGDQEARFAAVFSGFGTVVRRWEP